MLLAILAFPDPDEEAEQTAAAAALCADLLRITIAAKPDDARWWCNEYPEYVAIDARESRRRLRTFRRRLRDRMVAARMSMGFFQQAYSTESVKLPKSMSRLSLNELSNLVLNQSGESDADNVEKRVWRPSLPVIHLAAAMQVVSRALEPGTDAFGYNLDNQEVHEFVIALAQAHEKIVLSDARFGRNRDKIIRIRR